MDFDEFVNKLYEAGWDSPNDAQWTNIEKLWYEMIEEGLTVYIKKTETKQEKQ